MIVSEPIMPQAFFCDGGSRFRFAQMREPKTIAL
jgi:hypothetical protein